MGISHCSLTLIRSKDGFSTSVQKLLSNIEIYKYNQIGELK